MLDGWLVQRGRGLYAVCFALLLGGAGGRTADYYVSTSGNDTDPGTSDRPFRTITHAYALAAAGVTIHVDPGVYTDYTSADPTVAAGIRLDRSGTATNLIVLKSEVPGGAIIDGQDNPDRDHGIVIRGDYNVVDGFEVRRCPDGGIAIYGNGNRILNDHIHHNGDPGNSSDNGQDGVYSEPGTRDNVYACNWIDHNGRPGSDLDHGLYLCGQNELVINNVLLANAACGLQVAGYSTVSNLKVYNNVMAWNGTDGIILWQALDGVDIENNILYQNGHYGLGSYAASGSGVVVQSNLTYANGYSDFDFTGGGSAYTYSQTGNLSADPGLVDESLDGFDAHLAANSPAIQAGVNLSPVVTTDLVGAARPVSGAWDLGVFVYGVTTPDTNAPQVSLTAPESGAIVSGPGVTISATASDDQGVARVQFRLDGANLGVAVAAPPYAMTWDSTEVTNGTHTLSVSACDAAGNQTIASIAINVSNAVAALPELTVIATTPRASRVGASNGVFTISRTGDWTRALTVDYALAGTAGKGRDYTDGWDSAAAGTSVTIPAGAGSTTVTVTPLPSTNYVDAETVLLTLEPGPDYQVGSAAEATVVVEGNGIPSTIAPAPGDGVVITWTSVVGKGYRLAFRSRLTDPGWTDLSDLLQATGPSTSYTDAAATTEAQRYYVVYLTN